MVMSEEHKRKISESLRKYHQTCKPKKPKSEIQKEINRLQKRVDKSKKEKTKSDLKKEVIKLKKML